MKGKELAQMVLSGSRMVVSFLAPVLNKEVYLEPGMKGRLAGISDRDDEIFMLQIDLSEFDEFNKQFESANYFDKNGNACLTARQAGYYKSPKEEIYIGYDEEIDFLEIDGADRFALYEEYVKSGSGLHYVQWLEDRILAREKQWSS